MDRGNNNIDYHSATGFIEGVDMKKKSQQRWTVDLIIFVVVFISILLISGKVNPIIKSGFDKNICKATIAKAEAVSKDDESLTESAKSFLAQQVIGKELDCPMTTIDIVKSELSKDDKRAAFKVAETFANAAYDAWYITKQGEYNNFLDDGCILVVRINMFGVDEVLSKTNLADFEKWLEQNNPPGSPERYAKYLSYKGQSGAPQITLSEPLDPSENYYVYTRWESGKVPHVYISPEDSEDIEKCKRVLN